MQIKLTKQQIPWAMAAGRAALGPVLIAGDACGWSGLMMAWLVVTALVSDIFDGVLARRWHCETAAVRLFDSMADTVFYVCAAIALWLGVPQVWRANAGLLGVLLMLEALRIGLEFAKFGKPASYHSYLAKGWGLGMAIAVVTVFATGRGSPLMSVALALGIVCDLEGLAMSLMLPVWHNDVKTLRAAWHLRAKMQGAISDKMQEKSTHTQLHHATLSVGVCSLLVWSLFATSAWAVQPGQAAYISGTAGIGQDTLGVLDTTSAHALVFRFKKQDGSPGESGSACTSCSSVYGDDHLRSRLGPGAGGDLRGDSA